MSRLAVIIVNFNAGPALDATLASLPAGLTGVDWEAIVVDNASSDGSEQAAVRRGAPIRLLPLARNVGFAAGVNAGAAVTDAAELLLLNPDCQLEPGAVAALQGTLAAHPRTGVVGPRILDPDGTLQESARGDPALLTGVFGRTGVLARWLPWLPVVRRNLASAGALRQGAADIAVDWVSGACMLVRREAFAGVAGFDARYFLYWEDADFCRRLRHAGWETRYVPGATVVHAVGQSSRTARGLALRAFHESAYRYYATHVVPQRWHPARPLARVLLGARYAAKRIRAWMEHPDRS
ncbi:MAG: glycosyltransferase family 2 protein [Vicinamibacterales bacterium]